MARVNLSNAVNKLGVAFAEKGNTPAKRTLLSEAVTALGSAQTDDYLADDALALVGLAKTQAIFALETALNNMSGSGAQIKLSWEEKKLNSPLHTENAFETALAALAIPEPEEEE